MSSKIYITEETVRQAQSTADLPLLEERIVNLMRYRLRMIELTNDGDIADTYRSELKTLVKAANILFGPGHGKRLKARAKEQPAYFERKDDQKSKSLKTRASDVHAAKGTVHSVSAVLKPYGDWAGTSVTISGREAGTSDGAKAGHQMERKQAPWPRGPKAGTSDGRKGGTSAYTYGREAGVFVEHLPHDVAEGWKAGRHVSKNGAGAGTPLQQAAAKHNDGPKAGTPSPTDGRGAGTPDGAKAGVSSPAPQMERRGAPSEVDVNWTPFDDFAVGGTNDEMERKQGKYLAKLIAKKRGR